MINLLIHIKPCHSALSQPLRMAAHVLKRGDPLNIRRRRGKRHTMVMMFVGGVCQLSMELVYYSYHSKPMEQEFFVPARTPIGVKLSNISVIVYVNNVV